MLVMVGIVIAWPGLVTYFLDKQEVIDIDKVKIEVPEEPKDEPTEPSFPGAEPTPPAEDDATKLLDQSLKGSK